VIRIQIGGNRECYNVTRDNERPASSLSEEEEKIKFRCQKSCDYIGSKSNFFFTARFDYCSVVSPKIELLSVISVIGLLYDLTFFEK